MNSRRLLSLLLAGALAVSGATCGGDGDADTGPPTLSPASVTLVPEVSTATPTSSPAPSATPLAVTPVLEGFRAFASMVHDAVQSADDEFFRERMRTQHVVCTEQDLVPLGPGGPPCTEAGEELDVIPSGVWLSEGAGVEPAAAVELISALWRDEATSERDAYGPARAQVYAIGTWDDPEFGQTDVTFVTAIIAPGPDPSEELRVAFALLWHESPHGFELVRILQTRSLPWLFLDPAQLDRQYLRTWERFEP